MVQISEQLLTLAEFLQLPETKPATEFINGKIVPKPMPQGEHSRIQQKLVAAINAGVEDREIALALPELRCTFGGRSIVPAIAVFTWERLPVTADGTIANRFTAAPDWTIEILSPHQSSTQVTDNILHCLNHGSQLGWLIDPQEQVIIVYPPRQQPELLRMGDDRLRFPDFATGLHLSVEQIFRWLKIRSV